MSDSTAHDAHGERDFLIRLRPIGDDRRPAEIRLRQLLKISWRALSLRCVEVRELARSTRTDEPTPLADLVGALVANLPDGPGVAE